METVRSAVTPVPWLVAAAVVALFLEACRATPQGALRGDVYSRGSLSYTIGALPEGWRRTRADDADLAFANARLDAMIVTQSECRRQDDAPLPILAEDMVFGFENVRIVEDDRVTMSGREALHRTIEASLDGVPVGLDLYIVKDVGCAYTLLYSAPPAHFTEGVVEFVRFAAGFTLPAPGSAGPNPPAAFAVQP